MSKKWGSVDFRLSLLPLVSMLVIAGCSSDSPEPSTTPVIGTETDTGTMGTDAGTVIGTDAGAVGTDAGTIVGTDAGTVGADAGTIGGADAGTVGTDAGTNGGTDAGGTVGEARCSALTAMGSTVSVAGLYDITEATSVGDREVEDVGFLQITNNGDVILYDYQQDEFDQGDNCYIISSGTSVFAPTDNANEFIFTSYDDVDENCETSSEFVTLVRDATSLTFTETDTFDEDGDGDTTDQVVTVSPVLNNGLTVEAFNSCQ